MIEKIVRDYLKELVSVPVYIDVPANPADSYIVLERTGGGMEEHIRNAMVAIQSYSDSKLGAATLHETVLSVMPAIAEKDEIAACDINSEYNFTDTTTKKYRYQAVFDIIYY